MAVAKGDNLYSRVISITCLCVVNITGAVQGFFDVERTNGTMRVCDSAGIGVGISAVGITPFACGLF